MRIPLIVLGTSLGEYATVILRSGKWRFEKTEDAHVTIKTDRLPELKDSDILEVVADTPVQAFVHTKGTKPLTLYACLIP